MTQGCLIRIVDDDEDMRESLSFLLESEGWKCSAYSSAREFLIEDAGSVPGCLILDIRMPEMTGLELQQEMNRRKIFLPIVFLTGHGSIDMAVSAMKSGAELSCNPSPIIVLRNSSSLLAFSPAGISSPVRK